MRIIMPHVHQQRGKSWEQRNARKGKKSSSFLEKIAAALVLFVVVQIVSFLFIEALDKEAKRSISKNTTNGYGYEKRAD